MMAPFWSEGAASAAGVGPFSGLVSVVLALIVLALVAEGVSRAAKALGVPQAEPPRPEPVKAAETVKAASVTAPVAHVEGEDPARIAAIITAAIKCVVPEDFRIVSIQLRQGDSWELLNTWAVEGRRQIYTSHKIR